MRVDVAEKVVLAIRLAIADGKLHNFKELVAQTKQFAESALKITHPGNFFEGKRNIDDKKYQSYVEDLIAYIENDQRIKGQLVNSSEKSEVASSRLMGI